MAMGMDVRRSPHRQMSLFFLEKLNKGGVLTVGHPCYILGRIMDTVRPICPNCQVHPRKRQRCGSRWHYNKLCSGCWRIRRAITGPLPNQPPDPLARLRRQAKKALSARRTNRPYAKYRKELCEQCGFAPAHPAQLEVDHIDEDHRNNTPSNLQTLCANCHRLKTAITGNHRRY